jgi:hypothetical protein
VALFERACANDSTGHGDEAEPLYREARSVAGELLSSRA